MSIERNCLCFFLHIESEGSKWMKKWNWIESISAEKTFAKNPDWDWLLQPFFSFRFLKTAVYSTHRNPHMNTAVEKEWERNERQREQCISKHSDFTEFARLAFKSHSIFTWAHRYQLFSFYYYFVSIWKVDAASSALRLIFFGFYHLKTRWIYSIQPIYC